MKVILLFGSVAILLFSIGCSRTPTRVPAGVVYEGKRVSEWGEQLSNPDLARRVDAAKVLVRMGDRKSTRLNSSHG